MYNYYLDYSFDKLQISKKLYDAEKSKYYSDKYDFMFNFKNPQNKTSASSLYFSLKKQNTDNFFLIEFKPVYNDIKYKNFYDFNSLDLDILNTELIINDKFTNIRLNKLLFFNLKSIVPYNFLTGNLSGGVKISLERLNFYDDLNIVLDRSVGVSFLTNNKLPIFYFLWHIQYMKKFLLYPEFGFIWNQSVYSKLMGNLNCYVGSKRYNNFKIIQSFFL